MVETDAMIQGNSQDLTRLWEVHQAAEWPAEVGSREGELMTLDTVVCGCVAYFFEEHELVPATSDDPRRLPVRFGSRASGIERGPPGLFPAGQAVGRIAFGSGSPVTQ